MTEIHIVILGIFQMDGKSEEYSKSKILKKVESRPRQHTEWSYLNQKGHLTTKMLLLHVQLSMLMDLLFCFRSYRTVSSLQDNHLSTTKRKATMQNKLRYCANKPLLHPKLKLTLIINQIGSLCTPIEC